jgi:hypothetical protein
MFMLRRSLFGCALISAILFAARAAELRPIPGAFGPHVKLRPADFAGSRSFRATDRIVGTYYFYWYDTPSKAHIIDPDGSDALTTHPPTLDGLSYKSVAWHRRQLEDMMAAGIDVVLPVFWGAPSEHDPKAGLHWSFEGLPPLVQARDELLLTGRQPPRIGLFYDTSTLQYNSWNEHQDLTTPRGREWFYATVRDFFSLIPPRHWAMIDGRPIILLYGASFAQRHDQGVVDYLRTRFPQDFGGRLPWLAREVSWQVKADSVVAWGGALGLKTPGGVASIGPGYDHSAVPGRAPLVVERRDGKFYEEQWLKLLRRAPNFVMIETWNEWHEGTDIAESKEYGRKFIELTRKYADLYRQGWKPAPPKGPFTGANSVMITLGTTNRPAGLTQLENEDGSTQPKTVGGREGRGLKTGTAGPPGRYLYFSVDDSFKPDAPANFRLDVSYYDAAPGSMSVEFDGIDPNAPFGGAYTRSPNTAALSGSKRWVTASFSLPRARFDHGQNRNADFRLVIEAADVVVGNAALQRLR